ncbi:MAG: prolyl oligopeptidase family serine peptidase [Chlamydiota bacterium]
MNIALGSLFAEVDFQSKKVEESRAKESRNVFERCKENIRYYALEEGQTHHDITELLLASKDVAKIHKSMIIEQNRRIVVFEYPSDGNAVKGYISYTPKYKSASLLVFLRGGNRILGLMNPANDFSFAKDYTVIATTYRGGMNEGRDEFGGSEVEDVENLVQFIPQLESMLQMQLAPHQKFILGGSRGGMEMFLALVRSPFLQNYFDKAISLSGPMDLRTTIALRQDMKNMFVRDFGLTLGERADAWLTYRSPIHHCCALRKDLPLLIIQGTEDHRTHLSHGRAMFAELSRLGNNVTYWEIAGATHCLANQRNRIGFIVDWLENF